MSRRRRQSIVGLAAGALLVTGLGVAVHGAGTPVAAPRQSGAELPGGLEGHLESLRQGVPGNGGESEEGPGGGAEDAFDARAYPAETVSLKKLEGARDAFATAKARGKQAKNLGRWKELGPDRALYPFTEFRNSGNYVPNEYVAGGRTTSMALSDSCDQRKCVLYATPAGGGVWRTDNALDSRPRWKYLGGPLGINAAGSVTIDQNDPSGDTIYVGTGEANVCGSGCVAGVGLYKSTNGGKSWTGPLGGAPTDSGNPLAGKGIAAVVIPPGQPSTIYAATTTALRGMSSSCCAGVTRPVPDAEKWGLYKSTDGGSTWAFIHNGSANAATCTGSQAEYNNGGDCSPRGVRNVELDPTDSNVLYASSYARGVWRSSDAGATWVQIKQSLNPGVITTRPAIDVTTLPNGDTRMYVYEGNVGTPYSRLFRSDSVRTGAPVFRDLTSENVADDGYATFNQCTGQCWYDVFVHTPEGHPDVVYTGGSYVYGETGGVSNGRGVVLSTDAGESGTDMTMDGTDPVHPNGLHPDQHAMVTVPGQPFVFIEANDGGMMRSSGEFVDRSAWCDDRGLAAAELARCQQLLSKIPSRLTGINDGLNTLQFIRLSVNPRDVRDVQGGTQDNGTWENQATNRSSTWLNTMIGDGGWSGFDSEIDRFRFHNFFDVSPEVNFDRGDIGDWIWVADPLFGHAGSQFYAPVISDPVVSGTMFAGTGSTVYRTKTHGLGSYSMAQAQEICNTWTGTFAAPCGDWVPMGPAPLSGTTAVNDGDAISIVARTPANTNVAWAASTTGKVWVTTNADAEPASAVVWNQINDDDPKAPNRFVSGIYIDPNNPNAAYLSYSGYSRTTPATPGHVFRVVVNGGTATWQNRSYDLDDLPITDVVLDERTGDLFASSDFGVLRLPAGSRSWQLAARGMPNVEVAGLTLMGDERALFAASHGLGAWRLDLKKNRP